MEANKQKTTKILNIDCGSVKIEGILKISSENGGTISLYQKGRRWIGDDPWPTNCRKCIGKVASLVDALDFISNYIANGEWKKLCDEWKGVKA